MENRYKDIKTASYLGIIGNIFLFVIKIIIGFISNSQALLADAINSGSDILNSILTFIGNKISSKKADDDHNLGHGKIEYFYSLIISIIMIMLGIKVIKNASTSIIEKSNYNFSYWILVVCITTIITKLILYFYPKDMTSGCSKQACNFSELHPHFNELGAEVVGVSKDSIASHKKFEEKFNLKITLLSDPDLEVIQKYDVWKEKTLYGKKFMGVVRSTYLIDEKGYIIKAMSNVKAADNPSDVLKELNG